MRHSWKRSGLVLATFGLLSAALPVSCGDGPVAKKPGHSHAGEGGEGGGGSGGWITDAPPAMETRTVTLDEPLSDVVELSGITVGLHSTSGVSLLDMTDPRNPAVLSRLVTTGKPVGVAFDAVRRVLFVASESGDLRAYLVANPRSPSQAAQSTIAEPDETDSIRGIARVGTSLFLLGASHLLPVSVTTLSGGLIGLAAHSAVELDSDPTKLAAGGGRLYVAFEGGAVQVWNVDDLDAPAQVNDADFGADIVGWVVRGDRLFLALGGVGVRVVKLGDSGSPEQVYEETGFDDIAALKRSGNLVLIALSRGLLVAVDLSDVSAPRPLVTREGSVPTWASAVEGNLLLGSDASLSVFGVPPFVDATVPSAMKEAFPRYGRIPLKLSKPLDPTTVDASTVQLLCNGDEVAGDFSLDPSLKELTFLPNDVLPAGAECSVAFTGVKDKLGLPVSTADLSVGFTTVSTEPGPVEFPTSSYPHTADGAFTDWEPGAADYEYEGVEPAQGMYSRFYADHDGTRLWMLNDWFYNGDAIDPDCYNQFGVYSGGGSEFWEIRAYGDQHIEVRRNGAVLPADDTRVVGGYSHVATPNDPNPHTVYEIGVRTGTGSWGVQLHDPGPTYGCDRLETDPTTYAGQSSDSMSSVDPSIVPTVPATPGIELGDVTGLTPTISWTTDDDPSNWTKYFFEISSGSRFGTVIFSTWVYGHYLTLPEGLLKRGSTFTFRVTAYNLAGTTVSDPSTFTVPATDVAAPKLESFQPKSVTQGTAQALTITGSGFVDGSTAFWDGTEVGTTYMGAGTVIAMLSSDLTRTVGDHALTVRNAASDPATESNELTVPVIAGDTGGGGAGGEGSGGTGGMGGTGGSGTGTCKHSECVVGDALPNDCSECTFSVCSMLPSCCTDGWQSGCVSYAQGRRECPCTGSGGTGSGGTGSGGTSSGGASSGGTGTGGASGAAGGGGALACFTGGQTAVMNQQGNCTDPLVFNLAGAQPGGLTLVHQHFSGASLTFGPGESSCGWLNTRNDIYQIQVGDLAQGFEVSVDSSANANIRIAVLEDSSCAQPENLCVDSAATGRCEVARFLKNTHFTGFAPYFVVGYLGGTVNEPITVRVRTF